MEKGRRVTTLDDALKALDETPYFIVNGATDVFVKHRTWAELPLKMPKTPLFIHDIASLKTIKETEDKLHIGATVTYDAMLKHPAVPELLKACLNLFASPGIRNTATLAGNIANASPAADGVLVLYALEATISVKSLNQTKEVPIQSWIKGPGETALKPNELITAITIPKRKSTHTWFKKVGGRRSDAISKVSFAGDALIEDGHIKRLSLALGAVYKTVVRLSNIEQKLINQKIDHIKTVWPELETLLKNAIAPIDDQRSTKAYRQQVALRMVQTFLKACLT